MNLVMFMSKLYTRQFCICLADGADIIVTNITV